MNWAVQTILYALGITVVSILIIMGIYKITSRGKQED
jgi:hypothetical protein